ncbi:MAG TPA: DUF4332 domain-containing protein [Stenomitos sp.]
MAVSCSPDPIDTLPGLSQEDCRKLHQLDLHTIAALRAATATTSQQAQLASRLAVPERWVRKWSALAELAQLPSVGSQYCGVLLHSGVLSVAQLATFSTHTLHRKILRLQVVTTQRRELCPHPGIVSQWIQEARQTQMRSPAQRPPSPHAE